MQDKDDLPGPSRPPIRRLGGLGCLTMVLAAVAAIWLLSTGNLLAQAVGILVIAVEIGAGLWLYNVAGPPKS